MSKKSFGNLGDLLGTSALPLHHPSLVNKKEEEVSEDFRGKDLADIPEEDFVKVDQPIPDTTPVQNKCDVSHLTNGALESLGLEEEQDYSNTESLELKFDIENTLEAPESPTELVSEDATEDMGKASEPAQKTNPEALESSSSRGSYKKKEIETISDLKGTQEEIAIYLCRKLRDTGSFGQRLTIGLACGQLAEDLGIDREVLKMNLKRLKRKGVISTKLVGNPLHGTVYYTIKHSVYINTLP